MPPNKPKRDDEAFRQRLRLRRTLMGLSGYLVAYVVLLSAFLLDKMSVSGAALAVAILASLLTNVIFFSLIISGWNRRLFRDPSMNLAQVFVGVSWMLWAVWSAPEARGLMTLLITPAFILGIFRLTTREQLGLAAYVSFGYGVIVFEQAYWGDRELVLDLTYWLVVTVMLVWLSFIVGYVSGLRHRLRERAGELEIARDRLTRLAITDELTGLYNRRHMAEILDKERKRALRHDRPFSLAVLDLDHFKAINDAHGHLAGDAVLTELAERIRRILRQSDWLGHEGDAVGRVGGEEFLLLLPEVGREAARQCMERIRECIAAEPFRVRGTTIPLTVSIGVATYRREESIDALHSRADRCLYRAKEAGRDRVVSDDTE